MNNLEIRRLKLRLKWPHRLIAAYLGITLSTWMRWHAGRAMPGYQEDWDALEAMIALSKTKGGRAELELWRRGHESQREKRKSGQL